MGLFTSSQAAAASEDSNVRKGNFRNSADAFINVSIAANTKSGRAKLGNGVRLVADRNTERELIELFVQAKEAGKEDEFNEWLKSQIIVDMKLAGTGGATLSVSKPDFLS